MIGCCFSFSFLTHNRALKAAGKARLIHYKKGERPMKLDLRHQTSKEKLFFPLSVASVTSGNIVIGLNPIDPTLSKALCRNIRFYK